MLIRGDLIARALNFGPICLLAALVAFLALNLSTGEAIAYHPTDQMSAPAPHASFQHSDALDFDSPDSSWDTGIRDEQPRAADTSEPLLVLHRPKMLLERDGFGLMGNSANPGFRITQQRLSLNLIRLGEALKATARWYRRPRPVTAGAKLVIDSFYDFGREVVDEGLILVRSRTEDRGLQAKLGPTWMRGGPAARLEVSF